MINHLLQLAFADHPPGAEFWCAERAGVPLFFTQMRCSRWTISVRMRCRYDAGTVSERIRP
jgi:hypothetical protein